MIWEQPPYASIALLILFFVCLLHLTAQKKVCGDEINDEIKG